MFWGNTACNRERGAAVRGRALAVSAIPVAGEGAGPGVVAGGGAGGRVGGHLGSACNHRGRGARGRAWVNGGLLRVPGTDPRWAGGTSVPLS